MVLRKKLVLATSLPDGEVGITDSTKLFFVNKSLDETSGTVTSTESKGFDKADARTLYSTNALLLKLFWIYDHLGSIIKLML